MNTPFKLIALTGALLLLAACQSKNPNTVYCDDKPVGSEFVYNEMTYLVADNDSIRDWTNMDKLTEGAVRYCTSHVTDMSALFYDKTSFNQPISDWDVSNVKDMSEMFSFAQSFNQPIGDWDVSNVTDMSGMFALSESFNQPIDDWDVSNVEMMESMFHGAAVFNQPLNNWNVSNVENMDDMFKGATAFNQDLSHWAKKPKMPWEYEASQETE